MDELRTDPLAAAAKGWGLFSAALGAASRTVQTTLVEPTLNHLTDPALQNNLRSGLSSLAENAQRLGAEAGGFVKDRAGVDLAGQFGALGLGSQGGRGRYQNAPGYGGAGAYADYPEEDDFRSVSAPPPFLPALEL